MILVDTSCWIEFLHPSGNIEVKERLSAEIGKGTAAVCGPVLCELLRGVSIEQAGLLREVFAGLVHISTLDQDWISIRDLALQLKARGSQPPILDMLLAVVARRAGATLWHFGDHHFAAIDKVLHGKVDDLKS